MGERLNRRGKRKCAPTKHVEVAVGVVSLVKVVVERLRVKVVERLRGGRSAAVRRVGLELRVRV